MSDHSYLCDLYGLQPSQAHELVDVIVEGDVKEMLAEQERLFLDAGRIVHLVWLTSDTPANVIRIEFNKVLQELEEFQGFNHLAGTEPKDPGQWFLNRQRGFKIRSKKINGFWLQCVFGGGNLVRSEMIDYLRNCTDLDFDESRIDSEVSQVIGEM